MKSITIIGSGNAATAISLALQKAGYKIMQVFSRDEMNATVLASKVNAKAVSNLSEINTDSDIYLIAVKDDAIAEVAQLLNLYGKIVAHTSGIKEKEVLVSASENFGVFYPFVSMTKGTETDFSNSLLMLEGSNSNTLDVLHEVAISLSNNVMKVETKQRQSLHLAAVFAHNFTNHLYSISETILEENQLSFDYLKPLIASYFQNLQTISPALLQTGPAVRRDTSTIKKHLELLEGKEDLKEIYNLLTAHIQGVK
jgi:predicted short-subunit dehydrogenase-like oxidoreductase (DUF2520 family)